MKKFAVLQLSGCSGCEIALLNAEEWIDQYDLAYMNLVMSAHEVPEVEVLLVTGGVRTEEDLYRLRRAVRKAGEVIAVGTCAISGGVANLDSRSAVRQEFFAHEDRHHLPDLLPMACDLFDSYWESSLAMRDRIGTWGDEGPSHYIATVDECRPNYDGDLILVMDPEGEIVDRFPAREFRNYLALEETDYSYADCTSYNGQMIRANSLARINMAEKMGTPRADQYLVHFRTAFNRPAHAILLFDLARGIELVYGLERAIEILAEPLDGDDADVPYTPSDGDGYGLVEAPRGPLIHHYHIENGLVTQAEFIIPTMHNVIAIERALRVAAERYINADRVDMELERAIGRVVRAFDPCIACATH